MKYYILSLLCAVSYALQSQNVQNQGYSQLDTLATMFIKQANIPGLSMAISKNETVVYTKAFGYSDIEGNQKMTINTRLRTASVAKVITATAIGRLASQNKIQLDAPIKTYVPYIDTKYEHLTTRQLAGHTSGLAHRPNKKRAKKKQYNAVKETVLLMDSDLLFEPDTAYKYSTHAYNLLAAVIEGASGKKYMDYMQENIFTPLGMKNTVAENIKLITKHDAQLYTIKNNKIRKERLTNDSYKLAGAAFRSTPLDLVLMMKAYSNGFISKKVVNEMFKSHQLKDGTKTNVGIAWRSSIDPFNNNTIEHAGNWRGARTVIVYFPEENLTISLMVNASCSILIEETAHMFAQILRTSIQTAPKIKTKKQNITLIVNSQKKKKTYAGTFSFNGRNGVLKTKNQGFMKHNPIHYLGNDYNYTLATSYGLLYVHLKDLTIGGKIFTYYNRLSNNPKEAVPYAVFKY